MKEEQARLIAECIKGDEAAIARFLEEYQPGVFKLTLSILNDPGEASEATQDTFIAAFRALRSYRERATLTAWLYKIALNISRSRLRKRNALERLQHTLISIFEVQIRHSSTPEDNVIRDEEQASIWKALDKLGEKHRIPIVLRYYHDLSIAEIAEIMNIKAGTVHSRLSIGRDRLRAHLEDLQNTTGEQ
jgi:RNA polymerase sigma-70 factor (ECF subfamily)